MRYLYQLCELEGGRRHATDPVWYLQVYRLGRSVTKPDEPVLYYLLDGPERGFVCEELLVVPPDTELPPMVFSSVNYSASLSRYTIKIIKELLNKYIQLDCTSWNSIFMSMGQSIYSIVDCPLLGI